MCRIDKESIPRTFLCRTYEEIMEDTQDISWKCEMPYTVEHIVG